MKTYAHAALAVFVVVLGIKMYASKVDDSIQSQITQSRDSVLTSTKSVEELENLDMVESYSVQRTLAHLTETGEEDLATRLNQLDQLALELEQAYLDSGDNFEVISHLKERIINIKEAASMSISNVEEWDLEFVYYLIIEERMTLEEINALSSPTDLNLNKKEWDTLLTHSQTSGFKKKIFEYKNIDEDPLEKHLETLESGKNQEELIQEIWGDE